MLLSFIFFYSLKMNGRLRCKAIYEIIGQDFMKHQSAHRGVSISHVKDLQRMMRHDDNTKKRNKRKMNRYQENKLNKSGNGSGSD